MEITETSEHSDGTPVQAQAHRRPATFDHLLKKRRREVDVEVRVPEDDGGEALLVLRYRALSSREFDDLVAAHPPTPKQKLDGLAYNPDTFGPALVSAVCIEPKMTVAQAKELLESPDWSPGEVNTLTGDAMRICQQGAGVPFT